MPGGIILAVSVLFYEKYIMQTDNSPLYMLKMKLTKSDFRLRYTDFYFNAREMSIHFIFVEVFSLFTPRALNTGHVGNVSCSKQRLVHHRTE